MPTAHALHVEDFGCCRVGLRGARHCAFEQCRLADLGTFAFDVMAGCADNQFVGNEIARVAAGGFRVNGGTDRSPAWERTRNNQITDNWLHHYGVDYPSAVGVLLMHTEGNQVAHNHLHHGGWGIYHDEGSTHLVVENNVVHHTKFAPFNIHFAKEITVRNNIFALGKLEQASRSRSDPHKSVYFENNIVYWREGELFSKNWKDVPYTFYFHPKDKSGPQRD